jgi:hypothetical protein
LTGLKLGLITPLNVANFLREESRCSSKVFLATAATVILAGASMSAGPAQAGMMNMSLFECAKKAKAKHPGDRKAAKACRKSCKAKKGGLLKK